MAARTRLQQIINSSPAASGWEQCWVEKVTPWDLGRVTPVVQHLVEQDLLPKGKCLVAGCGAGYDAVALASPFRHVVGLDISETAIERAKELASRSASKDWVGFKLADFFTYTAETPFDVIFDYTFFCALDPSLRFAWARKMAELLAQDGQLITLMFPVGEYFEGGPPFSVSPEAYKEVLEPCGLHIVSLEDNKLSIEPRKGREMLVRWKKLSPKFKL